MVPLAVPPSGASLDLGDAYDAHASELFGFALNALRDRGAAEDCIQEVFLRAWRSRGRYDPAQSSVRTWLFAITRNAIRDRFRTRQREPHAVGPDGLGDLPVEQPDPARRLMLVEALATLSREHRQAVVGIHLLGVSYAELSQALDVPIATLRTRTYYGLRALRTHFDQGEDDHG